MGDSQNIERVQGEGEREKRATANLGTVFISTAEIMWKQEGRNEDCLHGLIFRKVEIVTQACGPAYGTCQLGEREGGYNYEK